jgi:uncharacterized protein (DUF433 family)
MKPPTHPLPPSAGSPAEILIRKTPGVCGGAACVRDTRITVWGLEEWRRVGLADEEILQRVEGLTRDDLAAA